MKDKTRRAVCFLMAFLVVLPMSISWMATPAQAANKRAIRSFMLVDTSIAFNSGTLIEKMLSNNRISGYETIEPLSKVFNFDTRSKVLTVKEVNGWIDKAFRYATKDDISYFYFAGHGVNNARTGEALGFRVAPSSRQRDATQCYYSFDDFVNKMAKVKGQIILIVDCCFSGAIIKSVKKLGYNDRPRFTVITASRDDRYEYTKAIKASLRDYVRVDENYLRYTYMLAKGAGFVGSSKMDADRNNDRALTASEITSYTNNFLNNSIPQYYGNSNTVIFRFPRTGGGGRSF